MSYALLKPAKVSKLHKSDVYILTNIKPATLRDILSRVPVYSIVAVDTETNGTQAADTDVYPVGIGISHAHETIYVDLDSQSDETLDVLRQFLLSPNYNFIGHNIFFDGAILQAQLGTWMNWTACTYGLFRQLANEGWVGQKYGLKQAQLDLLGWDTRGDVELDEWLVAAGVVKNYEHVFSKWSAEERLADFRAGGSIRVDKSRMSLAPPNILGYYCGLDAYSTYKLYTEVLLPAIQRLPAKFQEVFTWYHSLFITNVELLVQQQLRGVYVNTAQLDKFESKTRELITQYELEFRSNKEVAPYLKEWEEAKAAELIEPAKYKKLPVLGEAPAEFTKAGKPSKSYAVWLEKKKKIEALGPGEISQVWLNWQASLPEKLEKTKFNLHSGSQRSWLFYEKLNKPVKVFTKSDKPATDKKALPGFGEPGLSLSKLDKQTKLLGFVEALRGQLDGDNLAHPRFNTPGTFTGRLGGSGGFNWQNLPKSGGFMKAISARPGMAWVSLDFASLENYVLCELSRDPSLLKLYGPNAPEFQDAYLFNASQLPIIGPKIRATGYDPNAPTEESINRAKKEAKKERDIGKVITLSANYGAGPGKIQQTLDLSGIKLSFNEAKQLHLAFWNLYAGIKEYRAWLEEEWERRGGWVFNGVGRPICVYVDVKKDLVNRVVQSTGHDCLMIFISYIYELVKSAGFVAYPVLLDTHDETIWECGETDAPKLKLIFEEALVLTNNFLAGGRDIIRLKGDAQIVYNLAENKGLVVD